MLNIFQNLTASSLYIDFNDPTDLSKELRRTNISLCQTQLAACYQNGAHENQGTTCVWHTRKVPRIECPATSKKKSRTPLIAHCTGTQSASACIHARTEIGQHLFARSRSLCIAIFCESHSISHRKTSILHRKLRCDTG